METEAAACEDGDARALRTAPRNLGHPVAAVVLARQPPADAEINNTKTVSSEAIPNNRRKL
jgi:hypothetical protein